MLSSTKELMPLFFNNIKDNDFKSIYDYFKDNSIDNYFVGDFTYTLLSADIDPLDLDRSFNYIPYGYLSKTKIKEFIIPSYIQRIEDFAFESCANLQKVDFSQCLNLTIIENDAFHKCKSLEKVDLSNTNLEVIEDSAFIDCENLKEIILPSTLKTIDKFMFAYCYSLEEIKYKGTVEGWFKIHKPAWWTFDSYIKKIICVDGEITI